MKTHRAMMAAALLASAFAAPAACLTGEQASELYDRYASKQPAGLPAIGSESEAACSRAKLNALLALHYGKVVGYKAGLTNPAVQKRFGADKPVWGILYDGMILDDGATVDAAFGARPLFEADMLVRVKSADVNRAKTPMDVMDSIDQIIPFIELPDLIVATSVPLNGNAISAINVGARLGVAGKPISVPAFRGERFAMIDALRDMVVVVSDTNGAELSRGKGSDILEHPLNAVVWLAEALAKEGLAMEPGQWISLGSFSPLVPPKPGQKVTVRYEGLPGAAPVTVSFR
ncbi:MAG: 2-keto-4-pentenoate hydratase [Caldimonas sp.]